MELFIILNLIPTELINNGEIKMIDSNHSKLNAKKTEVEIKLSPELIQQAVLEIQSKQQKLTNLRANCRIWVHLLLWWFIPFGWIVSTYKMRYGIPLFVMLSAISLAMITQPSKINKNFNSDFYEGYLHGQKYSMVATIMGSALTVREILKSRQTPYL